MRKTSFLGLLRSMRSAVRKSVAEKRVMPTILSPSCRTSFKRALRLLISCQCRFVAPTSCRFAPFWHRRWARTKSVNTPWTLPLSMAVSQSICAVYFINRTLICSSPKIPVASATYSGRQSSVGITAIRSVESFVVCRSLCFCGALPLPLQAKSSVVSVAKASVRM